MKVPLAKPYFNRAEVEAVDKVLKSGWVAQGSKVAEFEKAVCQFTGASFARATSSCTTALHLALLALGIGPGDEVIVPSFTFVASANAIEYTGAKPVFVDIDPQTFCIDPHKVEECLGKSNKIKCIMPVHLFGLCANMHRIIGLVLRHSNLSIVEDAACALGSSYAHGFAQAGTDSNIGCFSFHPRKPITTGEGGMLVTYNPEIAAEVSSLRDHGVSISSSERHDNSDSTPPAFDALGYNYRMSDIHAAIGIEQMKKLSWIIDRRIEKAQKYDAGLQDIVQVPHVPEGHKHTYQSYVIRLDSNRARDVMMAKLAEKGIGTRQGTSAVHELGYYRKKYGLKSGDCPMSAQAAHCTLALPMYPQMTDIEQDYVIENVRQIVKETNAKRS